MRENAVFRWHIVYHRGQKDVNESSARRTPLMGNTRLRYDVGAALLLNAEVAVNRKNPGLAELTPMSKEEELDFHRYHAFGWTGAALLYTVYTIWQRVGHHAGIAIFGWLMASFCWFTYWCEMRKRDKPAVP